MQTPDFWSVPFASRDADGAAIGPIVRDVIAATGAIDGVTLGAAAVPATYDDFLGAWCSEAFANVFDPQTQLDAARALGLLP